MTQPLDTKRLRAIAEAAQKESACDWVWDDAFLSAFDPPTVLQLLAELDAARSDRDSARTLIKELEADLERTERQMDKEIRAVMRERGDYRGRDNY